MVPINTWEAIPYETCTMNYKTKTFKLSFTGVWMQQLKCDFILSFSMVRNVLKLFYINMWMEKKLCLLLITLKSQWCMLTYKIHFVLDLNTLYYTHFTSIQLYHRNITHSWIALCHSIFSKCTHQWSFKYLFHMNDVRDVPCILSECPQRYSITSYKARCEVRQSFLFPSTWNTFPQAVKEQLIRKKERKQWSQIYISFDKWINF